MQPIELKYKCVAGESLTDAISEAIQLCLKYNCTVQFNLNDSIYSICPEDIFKYFYLILKAKENCDE